MLGLLDPVIPEQALELRVELVVVSHAVNIVRLGHPLEAQDSHCDGEWAVAQYRLADLVCRANQGTPSAEGGVKFLEDAGEELAVLFFLGYEVMQSFGPEWRLYGAILSGRADERHDESLDELEQREVATRADVIQPESLRGAQKAKRLSPGKRLRQKRPGEVQALVCSEQIPQAPVRAPQRHEDPLVSVKCGHGRDSVFGVRASRLLWANAFAPALGQCAAPLRGRCEWNLGTSMPTVARY